MYLQNYKNTGAAEKRAIIKLNSNTRKPIRHKNTHTHTEAPGTPGGVNWKKGWRQTVGSLDYGYWL